jgi:serine/threonine-protein kinase
MSPEQAQSEPGIDQRSDIFSLGIVLYELLTGNRPFEGKNLYEIIYKIINTDPAALKEHAPDISHDLELVVSKAISKKKRNASNSNKLQTLFR